MNNKIQLSTEQRNYLIRLKYAIKKQINSEIEDFNPATDVQTFSFLRKILNNGYYHKQSAPSIRKAADRYHHLIENSEEIS